MGSIKMLDLESLGALEVLLEYRADFFGEPTSSEVKFDDMLEAVAIRAAVAMSGEGGKDHDDVQDDALAWLTARGEPRCAGVLRMVKEAIATRLVGPGHRWLDEDSIVSRDGSVVLDATGYPRIMKS